MTTERTILPMPNCSLFEGSMLSRCFKMQEILACKRSRGEYREAMDFDFVKNFSGVA